jgi:hypothetical protein
MLRITPRRPTTVRQVLLKLHNDTQFNALMPNQNLFSLISKPPSSQAFILDLGEMVLGSNANTPQQSPEQPVLISRTQKRLRPDNLAFSAKLLFDRMCGSAPYHDYSPENYRRAGYHGPIVDPHRPIYRTEPPMPRPMQYPIVNPFISRHTYEARHPIPLWEPDDPYESRHSLPRVPMPTANPLRNYEAHEPISILDPDADPYYGRRHNLPRMPMPTANPFGRPPLNPAADAAYQAGRRDAFVETMSAAEDAAYRNGRKDAEDEHEYMRTTRPPPYRPCENERRRRW